MKTKKTLTATAFIDDIRGGLSNAELMEKYQLSPKLIQRAFVKLVQRGDLYPMELAGRITPPEHIPISRERRKSLRQYPACCVYVHEKGNMTNRGVVFDISDMGLRVKGISAAVDAVKTLVIEADELDVFETFSFEAACRWVEPEPGRSPYSAGFEITYISERDLEQLLNLTQLQTISFG
ncbi:MAG: PilZ domain-containing protein [Thermodesulfobacteriota bacterium]